MLNSANRFPRKIAALVCGYILSASILQAAVIDTVVVGNAGNVGQVQWQGTFGAVDHAYRIGTYEVTNGQYTEFLNAVDPSGANSLALYSSSMSSQAVGGIDFNSAANSGLKYELKSERANNPVVFVTWFDAIRFTNWLHNGQGGPGTTESGAYTLTGNTPTPLNSTSIFREPTATWFLPNENEWYKAAYHKNDGVTGNYFAYSTSTDVIPYSAPPPGNTAPTPSNVVNYNHTDFPVPSGYNGGYAVTHSTIYNPALNYLSDVGAYASAVSAYGTFDQGGNVREWIESDPHFSGVARGGDWKASLVDYISAAGGRLNTAQNGDDLTMGFRVATVVTPEFSGDFDHSGDVDGNDLLIWQQGLGSSIASFEQGDANLNGTVDQVDLGIWQNQFGVPQAAIALGVPEPFSAVHFLIGAATTMASQLRRNHRLALGSR